MDENKAPAPEPEAAPAPEMNMPETKGPVFDMKEAPEVRSTPEMPGLPKISLTGAIGKARDTIIGSKHIGPEMVRVGQDYLDLPVNAVKTPLKALKDLVTLHPVKAVKDFASGAGESMGNMVDIVSAPGRLAVAGVYAGGRAVKTVAKLPFQAAAEIIKSPLTAFKLLDKGVGELNKITNKLFK